MSIESELKKLEIKEKIRVRNFIVSILAGIGIALIVFGYAYQYMGLNIPIDTGLIAIKEFIHARTNLI